MMSIPTLRRTHPAYDKWRPWEATNFSGDRNADARIVPLVEHLRGKGVVTTFSCSGHSEAECRHPVCAGFCVGHPGYLAVLDETVRAGSVVDVLGDWFSSVEMHLWPDPATVVFRWNLRCADEAMARLYRLQPRREGDH